jgi:hypothetical protein
MQPPEWRAPSYPLGRAFDPTRLLRFSWLRVRVRTRALR